MKKHIILLGASRRVGKDSFAFSLQRHLSEVVLPSVQRFSFANALRQECSESFNFRSSLPYVDFWTDDPELKEKVVRPILLAWGQARRYQDINYWAHKTRRAVYTLLKRDLQFAIITDWRFPNELDVFTGSEGMEGVEVLPIHISRSGQEKTPDEEVNDPLCHGMANLMIENNGSLEDLDAKAKWLAERLLQ
jgi:hypothetical protein